MRYCLICLCIVLVVYVQNGICFNLKRRPVSGSTSLKLHRKLDFFATTVNGLEDVLVKEISSLPEVSDIHLSRAGVHFRGSIRSGLEGLMNLRTSLKLMELVTRGDGIWSKLDLERLVNSVNWCDMIEPQQTLKVDTLVGQDVSPELTHTHFTSLTVKNVIVDQFRDAFNARPNVDTMDAHLPLLLYQHQGSASLYRVWSGCDSMHKRGYRRDAVIHKAALRETTAAALLLTAGWNTTPQSSSLTHTLIDPLCGSGTIPIEAALIACNTAPGLLRYSEVGRTQCCPLTWKDCVAADVKTEWNKVCYEAEGRDLRGTSRLKLYASDVHEGAIVLARESAEKAGVKHLIDFRVCDVTKLEVENEGVKKSVMIVSNPPWDMRLSEAQSGDRFDSYSCDSDGESDGSAVDAWRGLGCFAHRCGIDDSSRDYRALGSDDSKLSVLFALSGDDSLPNHLNVSRRSLRKKYPFSSAGIKLKLHKYT